MSVRRVLQAQGHPIFFTERTIILEMHRDKMFVRLNPNKSLHKRSALPTISEFLHCESHYYYIFEEITHHVSFWLLKYKLSDEDEKNSHHRIYL